MLKYFQERFHHQPCQQWGDRSDRETWLVEVKQDPNPVLLNPEALLCPAGCTGEVRPRRLSWPGHHTICFHITPPTSGTWGMVSHILWRTAYHLLEGAGLPSGTYPTQKHHCIPSFGPPTTDRLCWCLTPELCSFRSYFARALPTCVLEAFTHECAASNETGLLLTLWS